MYAETVSFFSRHPWQGGQMGDFIAQNKILGDILVFWAIKFVIKSALKAQILGFGQYFLLSLCSKVRFWAISDFKWAIFGPHRPGHPDPGTRVLGLRCIPSHMAPFEGEGPLTHRCDLEAGYGGVSNPNFGGAAPGFEPRTCCMRVRSCSHYATGAAPKKVSFTKKAT